VEKRERLFRRGDEGVRRTRTQPHACARVLRLRAGHWAGPGRQERAGRGYRATLNPP
jgi:hypothetical protein